VRRAPHWVAAMIFRFQLTTCEDIFGKSSVLRSRVGIPACLEKQQEVVPDPLVPDSGIGWCHVHGLQGLEVMVHIASLAQYQPEAQAKECADSTSVRLGGADRFPPSLALRASIVGASRHTLRTLL
jgi:hypothetical protein